MVQTFVSVALFISLLAAVPFGVKWIQRRSLGGALAVSATSRVISAVAVGPHQRVVTVEVGPAGGKTWLVLGVTAQSVTFLHKLDAVPGVEAGRPVSDVHAPLV
jgi:flagellar protein FliO/FliZ